jgi:hypothetical protein
LIWRSAWAAGVLLAFGACRADRDDALSREAVRITSAVRTLRDAPNADKALPLQSLADTSCTAADLCALRATCLDGYGRHVRALGSLRTIRRDPGRGGGAAAGLLAQAERELGAARDLVQLCARAEAQVRGKYRL